MPHSRPAFNTTHTHAPHPRLLFSYEVLTPAALNFFVSYADGAVESLWSIDQYFEFVLVLMLSTGLSFQVRRGGAQGGVGWGRWGGGRGGAGPRELQGGAVGPVRGQGEGRLGVVEVGGVRQGARAGRGRGDELRVTRTPVHLAPPAARPSHWVCLQAAGPVAGLPHRSSATRHA